MGGCKVGVNVGGVCITRRCALRGRARYASLRRGLCTAPSQPRGEWGLALPRPSGPIDDGGPAIVANEAAGAHAGANATAPWPSL